MDATVLEVCHVIGLAPRWIALAVRGGDRSGMRTELVPYALIVRITVRMGPAGEPRVGFNQEQAPSLHATPEEALRAAARAPVEIVKAG